MNAPEDPNGLREALARAEAERDEKARQHLHWMGVAARAMAENAKLRSERQIVDGRIRAQRASLRQAWGIIDKGQLSRAMQAHRRLLKSRIERTRAVEAERDAAKATLSEYGEYIIDLEFKVAAAEAEITRLKEGMEAAATRFEDIAAGRAFQPRLHAATGATEARATLSPKEPTHG